MNLRIWINPVAVQLCDNPTGSSFILVDGTKQHLHEEGGLLYFDKDAMSPVSRKLRSAVVLVTYIGWVQDPQQMMSIKRGRYVHGKFEAIVSLDGPVGKPSHLKIRAKAPTESLLKRWLNELLSGNDTPTQTYGEPTLSSLSLDN